jgi:16S rRNA (cytosine1407-C5)-methyltransferase
MPETAQTFFIRSNLQFSRNSVKLAPMQRKLPPKFIERIQKILPETDWESFFEKCTEPLPRTIRLCKNFDQPENWELRPVAGIPEAKFIERADQREVPLGKTLEYFTGKIYPASLASLLSAKILDAQPGEKVLDVCAAPGSKSTFLAEKIDSGVLVANELSASRSKKLAANIDRLGLKNVVLTQTDGTIMDNFFDQEFDKILLDAPCSSEGFGRRNADFFEKHWAEHQIFECAKLQKKLIASAWQMLRPGGEMVYSTCTSSPEENEAVVKFLLEKFPKSVEILPVKTDAPHATGIENFGGETFAPEIAKNVCRLWPHLGNETWDSEIFFIAKFRKIAGTSRTPAEKKRSKNSTRILSKNQTAEILVRLAKQFEIPREKFKNSVVIERGGEFFLTTRDTAQFCTKNPHRRAGLKLLDAHENPTTEFALRFGAFASKNCVQLLQTDRKKFLEGYDIALPEKFDAKDGTAVLVKSENFCLGWGKIMKNGKQLKNKLDRGIVF